MRIVLIIARRELATYLSTPSGYLIIAGVLFIQGLAFHAFALPGPTKLSSEVLADFLYWSCGLTMFCAILLSMRLLAEERQNRTLELLLASPIHDWQIVLGKFLSSLAFLAIFLVLTAHMPALVIAHGKVSVGHVVSGYLGLLLVGSASLAVGLFCSSFTRSQVMAALFSAILCTCLIISWLLAGVVERPFSDLFSELSLYGHFRPFERGLVHVKHIAYFLLVTYVALMSAVRILESRRWK